MAAVLEPLCETIDATDRRIILATQAGLPRPGPIINSLQILISLLMR